MRTQVPKIGNVLRTSSVQVYLMSSYIIYCKKKTKIFLQSEERRTKTFFPAHNIKRSELTHQYEWGKPLNLDRSNYSNTSTFLIFRHFVIDLLLRIKLLSCVMTHCKPKPQRSDRCLPIGLQNFLYRQL